MLYAAKDTGKTVCVRFEAHRGHSIEGKGAVVCLLIRAEQAW